MHTRNQGKQSPSLMLHVGPRPTLATLFLATLCLPFLTTSSFAPPNVLWDTPTLEPSRNKKNASIIGSGLPIGNGRTLAYVFQINPDDTSGVIPNSTFNVPIGVSFMVDMPEAMASDGSLFGLGMVSIVTTPSMFAAKDWRLHFTQLLNTSDASVTISTEFITVKVWVDANTDAIMTDIQSSDTALDVQIDIQSLRPNNHGRRFTYAGNNLTTLNINTTYPTSLPDVFTTTKNTISLSHRNVNADKPAYFNDTLKQQAMGEYVEELNKQGSNRWHHRQFGMVGSGKGLVTKKRTTAQRGTTKYRLVSTAPATSFKLVVSTLATQTNNAVAFNHQLMALHGYHTASEARHTFQSQHVQHWSSFWSRSYIVAASRKPMFGDPTPTINRKYALARYLQTIQVQGASKQGWVPIKFNGLCFTSHLPPTTNVSGPSARDWGPNSWWQNTRLPYGAMLASGDYDDYTNVLEFILQMVPFAKKRTMKYFNHSGIYFIETKTLFGAYQPDNYGTPEGARVPNVSVPYQYTLNSYLRYDFGGDGGTTEIANMVLDLYEHTNNAIELKRYFPLLFETLVFFNEHYTTKIVDGIATMDIFPTQSLETYWCAWENSSDIDGGTWTAPNSQNCITNDHPTVVGLHVLVERSFRLLSHCARDIWTVEFEQLLLHLQHALPSVPTIVEDGVERTSPYSTYPINNGSHNDETPELYGVHPFRYYTQGRQLLSNVSSAPAVQCMINSTRQTCLNAALNTGWNQGIMNAALLGLKSIAESMLVSRALTAPAIGYRFEGFAPHEQDFEREWCLGVVIVGVFCKNQPLFFVVCCLLLLLLLLLFNEKQLPRTIMQI